MLEKLKKLLIKDHNLNETNASKITEWINSQYNVEYDNEEDLEFYSENLRVFDNITLALDYELSETSVNVVIDYMKNSTIEDYEIGLTIAEKYLKECEYVKIEETGTYFYFYE